MTPSLRARLHAIALSPLLPIFAVIFLLPFGRASEVAVLICILGAVLFFVRAPRAWREHPGAGLLLACWLCYFAAALISAWDAVNPGKSWGTVAALIRFAPFGFYVCFAVRRESRARALYLGIGALVALWTLDAWMQILTGYSVGGHAEAQRISGIFGAGDLKLGLVLAVLSPFVAWSARQCCGRTGLLVALLLLLGPILLAGERAAWLMYALVVIACLWRETQSPARFLGWIVGACLVAALAAGIAWKTSSRFDQRVQRTLLAFDDSPQALDTAFSGRLDIWRTALKMAAAHPVNGVGVRGFRYAYPAYARPGDRFLDVEACGAGQGACHPHQIVLEVLDDTGAIGVFLWLIGVVLAVRAWRSVGAPARFRAWPVSVALLVMVFPINTHLAFYSAWWGLLFWWLLSLWCASLFSVVTPDDTAKTSRHAELFRRVSTSDAS
ncbi:MAG TPA: O-antigen ligase family protein [Rhodanobacteraceae bacterium]|nr:O-antigen ligase family protein [Rhodanobacteraceae bacterium]